MKNLLLPVLSIICFSFASRSQTVTNIAADYRNGQTFIVWDRIPGYTGFHYVYRHDQPITNNNISLAKYIGKVPYDFSLNYFLNLATDGGSGGNPIRYLVINNDPWQQLDETQGLFVSTISKQKTSYYAVTSDDGVGNEIMTIVAGSNATSEGVIEKVEPIEAILQIDDLPLKDNPDLLYDAYAIFGGNVKTQFTPAMANEGCLVFNHGIVPDIDPAMNNAATLFFYGGGGNAYGNANSANVPGMWKLSLEDVIPNFNWDPTGGENTKWTGYNENFDIYHANNNSPPPTTGINKLYTIARVKWTFDWFLKTFQEQIDSNRIYVHGSSNGSTAALAMSYLYPEMIAAGDVEIPKLNLEYLDDDNPSCKWNANGVARKKAEIFVGTLEDNLPSDVQKIAGTSYYTLWDFANYNNLVRDNKFRSLPIIFLTAGKSDDVVCWEEKIPFFYTVDQNKTGGFYYWDLRMHKGGNHTIKDISLEKMFRYNLKLSYPAFSRCSTNDDPGDTDNPNPPFYDGDTLGTFNGLLDWVDSTIEETSESWQAKIFSRQLELNYGMFYPFDGLPLYMKVDITPRRLQLFSDIPDGSVICMENWEGNNLIQSKSITYHTNPEGKGLITFRKAKISEEGNLIKIFKCGSPKITSVQMIAEKAAIDNVYPNPTDGAINIDLSLIQNANVSMIVQNILGEPVMQIDLGLKSEGDHSIPVNISSLPSGMYFINIDAGTQVGSYKVIKQ